MPKQKQEKKQSVFWNGDKPGAFLEGKFLGFERSTFNQGTDDERTVNVCILNTKEGMRKVSCGAVLQRLFSACYKTMKPGNKVRIELEEIRKGKRGRKTKVYSLFINGKQIENSYGVPLKGSDLDAAFAPPKITKE